MSLAYLEGVLIFLLAFVIIGPKDFPKVMFKVGDGWRRLRVMLSAFYTQLEKQAHEESEKSPEKPRRGTRS